LPSILSILGLRAEVIETRRACLIYAGRVPTPVRQLLVDEPAVVTTPLREPDDQTLAFGEFRLDIKRRRLLRGNGVTPLPERLFGVLLLLARANGAVVKKETFATIVWPDVVMTNSNLAQHIYQLRQLLGETVQRRSYISSASGRGYRFTAPVYLEPCKPKGFAVSEADAPERSDTLKAFLYVCQANYLLERCSYNAIEWANRLFDAALEIDCDYVPALLGYGRAYALAAQSWWPLPAFERAKEAVARALEMNPHSAAGHAIQSALLLFGGWNWRAARNEIELARELDPRCPLAQQNAAWLNICTGAYDSAMREARCAALAAPSSVSGLLLAVDVLIYSRRYYDAIAILSSILEHDPAFYAARICRARAYLFNARPKEAILDLNLIPADRSEDFCVRLPLLARAYADCGEQTRAAEVYAELFEATETGCVTFFGLATVAAALGNFGAAVCHLEKALARREPALLFLKSLPLFEQLSQFDRFKTIARAAASS
jgi:DNA-binding winged helix-turn-helix (wHTH) protein